MPRPGEGSPPLKSPDFSGANSLKGECSRLVKVRGTPSALHRLAYMSRMQGWLTSKLLSFDVGPHALKGGHVYSCEKSVCGAGLTTISARPRLSPSSPLQRGDSVGLRPKLVQAQPSTAAGAFIYTSNGCMRLWHVHTIRKTGDPIRTRNLSLFGPD